MNDKFQKIYKTNSERHFERRNRTTKNVNDERQNKNNVDLFIELNET